ncbi:MAG: hypothetical protein WEG36_13955 [Gemmatimonadota bacterium]
MKLRFTLFLLAAVGVAASVGCASAAVETSATGASSLGSSDSRTITLSEVQAVGGTNAFDVIARLHPNWLLAAGTRARSTRLPSEIVVVTDGQYFGPVGALRQIPIGMVGGIRYLTGTDATNQFPWLASGRHVEAAIIVSQRTVIP